MWLLLLSSTQSWPLMLSTWDENGARGLRKFVTANVVVAAAAVAVAGVADVAAAVECVAMAADVIDTGRVATAVGLVGAVCAGAVRSPLVVPCRRGCHRHRCCCSKGDMQQTRWQWTHPHQEHCQHWTHWHS